MQFARWCWACFFAQNLGGEVDLQQFGVEAAENVGSFDYCANEQLGIVAMLCDAGDADALRAPTNFPSTTRGR
jgi:hypothetical protein